MCCARPSRRLLRLSLLLALVGGVLFAYRVAVRSLRSQVLHALGPAAEIARVGLGWSGVTLEGLRIKGATGWPAADALRAKRIVVAPSLMSLFSERIEIRSILVAEAYVSAFRDADGRFEILPSLLGAEPTAPPDAAQRGPDTQAKAAPPGRTARIWRIRIEDGVFEMFDGSVHAPAHRILFEDIEATLNDLLVPQPAGRTQLELTAAIKGPTRDGRIETSGWADVEGEDCAIATRMKGVDLKTLEPYLLQKGEGGIRSGVLDLDLDSTVSDGQLRAPGHVTISELELAPSRGAGTFMGVSRIALLESMKNGRGQIAIAFVVEGDVRSPTFSLRDSLASRMTSSLAQTLGVRAGNLAATAESVGRSGVDAAKKAGSATGNAVKKLFDGFRSR
jgi:hypothetical protein